MKVLIAYLIEANTMDDALKVIKEIDQETGLMPVVIRQYFPKTDTLIPPPPSDN